MPEGTVEIALLFEDPDAPGGTLVQWVLFGISPELDGLEEGKAPAGSLGGKNDYGRTDWSGPCPPIGKAHRYIFTLLAVSFVPRFDQPPSRGRLLDGSSRHDPALHHVPGVAGGRPGAGCGL